VRQTVTRGVRGSAALLLLGLIACSSGELATRWIPQDAAIVRCTTAGRDRMQPVLLDLPLPPVPTGLLARQLDPMALNDMGFEREQPVCVALFQPGAEQTEGARSDVNALLAEHSRAGAEVRARFGRCACEIARAAAVELILAPCRDEPYRPECEVTTPEVDELLTLVAPLESAISATPIPRLHWRLAGRTDRPGWFVARLAELLPRHFGGATVFQPGQAIPSRNNHALVRRLLEVPGAVAVLHLDGGRAMMVARVLDGALVLDLFAHLGTNPRLLPLLPSIDDARVDDLTAALVQPAAAWSSPLPLDEGNLVHLDRAALRTVDSLVLAMAPLAGVTGAPGVLPEPAAAPLVDAVTLQAEFGAEGKRLRAHLRLSEAGQQWAQTLSSAILGPELEALGLPLEPAASPSLDLELAFVVHGLPTERFMFDGLTRAPSFLRSLEMHHPSSVGGRLDAWDVSLPPGAVAPGGTVMPPLELRLWAERVASERYRLRTSFDSARHHLDLTLAPD
jgi:hypothetical protein